MLWDGGSYVDCEESSWQGHSLLPQVVRKIKTVPDGTRHCLDNFIAIALPWGDLFFAKKCATLMIEISWVAFLDISVSLPEEVTCIDLVKRNQCKWSEVTFAVVV